MNEDGTDKCGCHVKQDIESDGIELCLHGKSKEPDRHYDEPNAAHQRVQHLLPRVKLNVLLVAGANTGDTDQDKRSDLAIDKITVVVDKPSFDAVMQICDKSSKEIKLPGIDGILEELQQNRYVNDCTEYLVEPLQFLAFFHRLLFIYFVS